MITSYDHNYGLDIVRLFAMFGVLLIHSTIYLPIPQELKIFYSWGGYGVQIFFVLSGYLAAVSLDRRHYSLATYYRKRALRILPSWYAAIFIGMAWITWKNLSEGIILTDIFHLRWLRFFLGLNMIVPSNNYYVWNNPFGWWTMSCFIWFYIAAPFLMKFTRNLKRSILMLPLCVVITKIWKYLVSILFGSMPELEQLELLSARSPFTMLYYFVIGIVCYQSIKEHREWLSFLVIGFIGVRGLIVEQLALFWGLLAYTAIIVSCHWQPPVHSKFIRKFLGFLSRQSFHIYLVHAIAYDIAFEVIQYSGYSADILFPYSFFWAGFAIILIVGMTTVLSDVSRLANHILG